MAIATSGLVSEWVGSLANAGSAPGTNSSPQVTTWDDLVTGNDGSLSGFTYTSTDGWDGDGSEGDPYSLVFPVQTDSNNYVNCGTDTSLNLSSITVEYWMYCTGGHNYGRIFRRRVGSTGYLAYIDITNNQVRFSASYSGGPTDLDQPFTPGITILNNWNHIAFTYDATAGELWCYANGTDLETGGYSGIVYPSGGGGIVSAGTEQATIGNNSADTTRPFGGSLCTVRVYNRALADTEVQENYLAGKIGVGTVSGPTIDAYQSGSNIIVDWS